MQIQLAMLWSDWLIYFLVAIGIVCFIGMRRQPHLREPWRQVLHQRLGMIALVVLSFYVMIGLLDSIHLRITQRDSQQRITHTQVKSVLDILIQPLGEQSEKSYSSPFATHLYSQSVMTQPDGREVRDYPRLQYGGIHLVNLQNRDLDIIIRVASGLLIGMGSFLILATAFIKFLAWRNATTMHLYFTLLKQGKTYVAWREAMCAFGFVWIFLWIIGFLCTAYHIFGTDQVGNDVFYESIKSIRTGLMIGTLTTLFMLPFALILGMLAGYFRGVVDDVIQYVYTTLSSIPGVLLISATILVLQVYIANHTELFPTLIQRADARLLALCLILGITSWASLCRLLRGETLKLREQEFILASKALGVSHRKIILRHIMPNVMHIVLITLVLDFSGLVLAEAVLSYVGVGVDPTTISWGNMINSSRLELAREPIVWWPLLSALVFMFVFVLAANVFADAVRDAFDPRLRLSVTTPSLPAHKY